jgi:hypothetical protein
MSLVRPLLTLLALAAALLFGLAWTRPPSPLPASAPPAEFSAARALSHLEVIARRPHRIGSAEHAAVRAYLVSQLQALGLAPEVQETVVSETRYHPARFATVRNVVARRKGTSSGQALLLVAHYDTRSMTPGASDDGCGVAALLETARALAAGEPLRSDLVFLFTDGEEEGLLGARAFVAEHPLARDVGLVLNFEARGDAGPALMFQTGDDNGALIRVLGLAAPHPAANSLSQAIYRRMPNDTDLSVWLPRTPSLNVANIGGFERYHAPTDTLENLDLRTLQHHGSYALSLARAFGARELPLRPEHNAAYFNAGPLFVRYPGGLEVPLAFASLVLLSLFVALAARRGALRPGHAAIAFAASIAAIIAAGAAGALAWAIAGQLHPAYALLNAASPTMKGLHLGSFIALGIATGIAAQAALLRRFRVAEIVAGGAAPWCLLAVLAAVYLPGGAFLFTWPALLALVIAVGLLAAGRLDHDGGAPLGVPRSGPFGPAPPAPAPPNPPDHDDPASAALQVAAALPAIALVGPFLPQLADAFGPPIGPAIGAITALLVAIAAPAARLLLRPHGRWVLGGALALAAAALVAANLWPPFDARHPRPDTLFFAVDHDAGRAFWISSDPSPDAWTGAVLAGASSERAVPLPFTFPGDHRVLAAPAEPVTEPAPAITWLAENPMGRGRMLEVRVVPPPRAEVLGVQIDGSLASVTIDGRQAPPSFRYYAPPEGGITLALTTSSSAKVTVRVVAQRAGFPDAARALDPRPPELMAKPAMMPPWDDLLESDMTLVATTSTR